MPSPCVSDPLKFDESALDRYGYSVGPVIGPQLRQDVRDVVFYCFLGDGQGGSNVSITVAGRDQSQDFDLAWAQFVFGCMVGQFGGNLRRDPFLPAMHGTDNIQ